jgi:hypothetical protein
MGEVPCDSQKVKQLRCVESVKKRKIFLNFIRTDLPVMACVFGAENVEDWQRESATGQTPKNQSHKLFDGRKIIQKEKGKPENDGRSIIEKKYTLIDGNKESKIQKK